MIRDIDTHDISCVGKSSTTNIVDFTIIRSIFRTIDCSSQNVSVEGSRTIYDRRFDKEGSRTIL